MAPKNNAPAKLVDLMYKWKHSPASMVRELFGVEPDLWQVEILESFRDTPRIAMLASKGVGKTCLLAWLIWNFLLTRHNPNIAAVSISGQNLSDNLLKELSLWFSIGKERFPLFGQFFTVTKTKIFANHAPDFWWLSARSWSQTADRSQQASALSGLHAKNVMFVLDESGAMPDSILASAENALSTCEEGHIVQAGNPEKLEGPLYRAYKSPNQWKVVPINGDPDNPKRSPRVSIEWARQQIKEWGRDNNYVKINVFGEFPNASLNALIGLDEVEAAMARYYRDYEIGNAAKIMGVDVARSEHGDFSVIAKRHGIQMYPFIKRRGLDSNQGASLVAREWSEWGADAVFVDASGGYGYGWIDQLANLGKSTIGVKFGDNAHKKEQFLNRRSEMAWDFVQFIKRGGAIPDSDELKAALTRTTYDFKTEQLYLEPKELVKAKLGYSPDDFDAAILTFADPVSAKAQTTGRSVSRSAVGAYDAFAEVSGNRNPAAYDPFSRP